MNRAVAGTNQNARSSRSHTIFVLDVEQKNSDGSTKAARLNLVDLAGSERIEKTGATGQTLKEAQKINLSLTTLGMCIKALTENSSHVPFRDSKLTLFLKQSLGGNSKTLLICTASALQRHYEESYQTCRFAKRAKKVKNKATSNVMRSPAEMEAFIKKLKAEVSALKKQLIANGIKPDTKAFKEGDDDMEDNEEAKDDQPTNNADKNSDDDTEPTEAMGSTATTLDTKSADVINDLESKMDELQNAYDTYKENAQRRILELEDLVEKAEEEKVDLDNYREKDFEIESLSATIDEKEEEISKLKKEKDNEKIEYETKIAELKASTDSLDRKVGNLYKQIESLKEENEKLNEKYMQAIHSQSESDSKYSGFISELEIKNEKLETDKRNLEKDQNELKSTIEAKDREIQSLNKKVQLMTVEIFESDEKLEREQERSNRLLKHEKELNDEIEEIHRSSSRVQDDLKDNIAKLNKEKSELHEKILELEKEKGTLENCVKENTDTKELLEEKDEMIKALKTSVSKKVEEAEKAKDAQIAKIKEELEEMYKSKDKVSQEYNELQTKLDESVKSKNDEIKKLEAEKQKIHDQIEQNEHELFKQKEAIQGLKGELEGEKNALDMKNQLISSLKDRLDLANQSVSELEIKNKQLEESSLKDSDQVVNDLKIAQQDNGELKDKLKQLEKQVKSQQSQIEELEGESMELKLATSALARANAENDTYKKLNKELNEQLDDLKKQLNNVKANSDRQVRMSTIAAMQLKKTIAKKIVSPEKDDEEPDEVTEGVYASPFVRKSTIIKKKIKFNNQIIDPSIMDKPDWELTATQKYQKSILEHYQNMKAKNRRVSYRDQNVNEYGQDIVYGFDKKDYEIGDD